MNAAPIILGMSLKMYFGQRRTLDWCREVASAIARHPAVLEGRVELFLLPSFPLIAPAQELFSTTPMRIGAQDLHWEDQGAFTGEVSGALLAEMGARYAEIGHAERRRLFGETDETVALKTAAALRNGLTPVLCVGETHQGSAAQAAQACLAQLESALTEAQRQGLHGEVILAYEPVWAIGAAESATPAFIAEVCDLLRAGISNAGHRARIIYGGSAGPGLLSRIQDSADGLFLGRFAHDPRAFASILDEVRLR